MYNTNANQVSSESLILFFYHLYTLTIYHHLIMYITFVCMCKLLNMQYCRPMQGQIFSSKIISSRLALIIDHIACTELFCTGSTGMCLRLHTIVLVLLLKSMWCVNTLTLDYDEETNGDITLTCIDGLNPVEATFLYGEASVATDTSSYTFTIDSATEGEYTCSSGGATSNRRVFLCKCIHTHNHY